MQSTTAALIMHQSGQASLLHGCSEPGLYMYEYSFDHCFQHQIITDNHIQHAQQFS